jgi:thiamine phosphate synthase YjbQ (UPF0047 family)
VIDINARVASDHGSALSAFPRALYFSFHTTAGYLEQSLASRLAQAGAGVAPFLEVFQTLFPAGAGYRHDVMAERRELSEAQRLAEPPNADSHLAYIGSGLRSCVTYVNRPEAPVYFIDLDGVHDDVPRRRTTRIVGFHREEVAARLRIEVPVSNHPVDSINLKDKALGIYERIDELIARCGVEKGRVSLVLASGERQAGLTVNEYETLLMQHDLAEVLRNPFRFMAEKASHALADPRAIPSRALEYAKYDLVRVFNRVFEKLGWDESAIERFAARFLAYPANRFLRMKRSLSLLVSDRQQAGSPPGRGHLVSGSYQSPILVQWEKTPRQARALDATLSRFL